MVRPVVRPVPGVRCGRARVRVRRTALRRADRGADRAGSLSSRYECPMGVPLTASLETWLRRNGVPALVQGRHMRSVVAGPFELVGFMLRSLVETVTRRGSSMLNVVPLLLVALTLSFFSTEVWQTIGRLHGLPLVLTTLLFVGLAAAFATKQTPPDLDELSQFADADDLREALPKRLVKGALADGGFGLMTTPALR